MISGELPLSDDDINDFKRVIPHATRVSELLRQLVSFYVILGQRAVNRERDHIL